MASSNDQLKAHTPAPTQLAMINTASPQNRRVRKDFITIRDSTIQPRPRTFRIVLNPSFLRIRVNEKLNRVAFNLFVPTVDAMFNLIAR